MYSQTKREVSIPQRIGNVLSALLFAIVSVVEVCSASEITYGTYVLTGDDAPGVPAGTTFSGFGRPKINAIGNVVFEAEIAGPVVAPGTNEAIYTANQSGATLIARTGDAFFNNPDVHLEFLDALSISISSENVVTFGAELQGQGIINGLNDLAVLSTASGALDLVTRGAYNAPGLSPIDFTDFFSGNVANSVAQQALLTELAGPSVGPTNDRAIYSQAGGEFHLVAREGDQAPGAGPGNPFVSFSPNGIRINDVGQTGLHGVYNTGEGLFLETDGQLQPIALQGAVAPGAVASFAEFSTNWSINNNGQVAFLADLNLPGTEAIYSSTSGSLQPVALTGDVAPGLNGVVTFGNFSSAGPLINAAGDTSFFAEIDEFIINDDVLVAERDSELQLIAREGNAAPGVPNAVFDSFIEASLQFNDAGQVAFLSDLSGPDIIAGHERAIFAEVNGELQLIAREGNAIDVNPDPLVADERVIDQVRLTFTGGSQDGTGSAFNALGQLAFELQFTDGSEGIFVADTRSPGDFDNDNEVDGADFLFWQRLKGDPESLQDWQSNYGVNYKVFAAISTTQAVPEPGTGCLSVLAIWLITLPRRKQGFYDAPSQ